MFYRHLRLPGKQSKCRLSRDHYQRQRYRLKGSCKIRGGLSPVSWPRHPLRRKAAFRWLVTWSLDIIVNMSGWRTATVIGWMALAGFATGQQPPPQQPPPQQEEQAPP